MEREKKDCILQAATRVFTRFGFRKAAVDEIAKQAGVAKGTVYLACESKEDLFYQTVNRELRAWVAECSKVIDPRVPADELLELVVRASIAQLVQRPLVRDLFLGNYGQTMPGWADRLAELRSVGRANVIEILRLGIKQGRFRADLDIENASTLLQDLHLAAHLFHAHEMQERPELLEPRLRAGLDLVLNGLRTRNAADAKA